MPTLPGIEKLEKVTLPSSQKLDKEGKPTTPENEWAWVVIDLAPMRAADLMNLDGTMREGTQGLQMVADRIREWNYQDETGQAYPITVETVGKLNMDDFQMLNEKILPESAGLTLDEKKASSPTSQPSEQGSVLE